MDGTAASQYAELLPPVLPPRRQQNKSCDRCRQSKRRCVPTGDASDASVTACRSCLHSGLTCTYHYISRVTMSRKRDKSVVQPPPSLYESLGLDRGPPEIVSQSSVNAESNELLDLFHQTQPEQLNCGLDIGSLAQPDPVENLGFALFDSITSANMTRETTSSEAVQGDPNVRESNQEQTIPQRLLEPAPKHSYQYHSPSFIDPPQALCHISAHGPTALLNSTLVRDSAEELLSKIYDSIITASAKLFLSCKQDGASLPIDLESETKMLARNGFGKTSLVNPVSDAPIGNPLYDFQDATLFGVCRFLDNFGTLFGNVLNRGMQAEEKMALIAAMHSFALQFAPLFPNYPAAGPEELFISEWCRASSGLEASKSNKTFTRLYAVFLLDLIAIPFDACRGSKDPTTLKYELLEHALWQLRDLERIVEGSLAHMSPSSMYRSLFRSALGIVKRYGYIRDTIASLWQSGRTCVFDDMFDASNHQISPMQSSFSLDPQLIPSICRDGSINIFVLYRKYIKLRRIVAEDFQSALHDHKLQGLLQSAMQFVEDFDRLYGQWITHCLLTFQDLPYASKQSLGRVPIPGIPSVQSHANEAIFTAFFIMFWNLGVFYIVEIEAAVRATASAPSAEGSTLSILKYQRSATGTMLRLANLIKNVSTAEDGLLISEPNTMAPFAACHANIRLVVEALQKAIDHTIWTNTGINTYTGFNYAEEFSNPSSHDWVYSMKPLLWCLSSLAGVNCGSPLVKKAIESLISRHGDFIMECWTPDSPCIS